MRPDDGQEIERHAVLAWPAAVTRNACPTPLTGLGTASPWSAPMFWPANSPQPKAITIARYEQVMRPYVTRG